MQINVSYDQPTSSLPIGFVGAVNYVVTYFDSLFTNPVTINISVGYGEIGGQLLASGALGESESFIDSVSYSEAVAALKANEPNADQQTAYATLPATSPLSGGNLWLTTAEERALGLLPANDPTTVDGYVGLSNQYSFSYSPTATPGSNQFYFVGVVEHEISEVLGRDSWLGDALVGTTSYGVMDLFRYSAPSVRDLTTTPPAPYSTAYFSINNGVTNLDNWNTDPSGDLGDWAGSAAPDAFLAFSPSGQIDGITPTDITVMNILGWDSLISSTVISNQTLVISSGQTSSGLEVGSAGTVIVLSGGTATSTTDNGGGVDILSGGNATGTMVSSGGTEVVSRGGRSVAATLQNGGVQYVLSSGTASGTTNSGGADLLMGGTASGTRIASGAVEAVYSGGRSISSTISNGGVQYLLPGGAAISTNDSGGADVISGGTASGTQVAGGGVEAVYSGGRSISATIQIGAVQYVLSGGVASGAIDNGGADVILTGGTASGTQVNSGGTEVASSGGASLSPTVLSGGLEYVLSGGLINGASLHGGNEQVMAGGTASFTAVSSGGYLIISSGGFINGATISGGTVEIVSGGLVATNPITYLGNAALILDASANFSGTVAGFDLGDFLDLRDISFASATLGYSGNSTSGTLTVSDGTHSANIALLGQYIAANFNLATDGHGGTVVTEQAVATSAEQSSLITQSQQA